MLFCFFKKIFQSTLPARGATSAARHGRNCKRISIHAPREGSDLRKIQNGFSYIKFQSTLPARGATQKANPLADGYISDFNPRSPRGERRLRKRRYLRRIDISIHAPREGSDYCPRATGKHRSDFNPRSPRGERHGRFRFAGLLQRDFNPRSPRGERLSPALCFLPSFVISIHAPREGSDGAIGAFFSVYVHFNPRSPRGERQQYCTDIHDPNGNIATRLPNEACLRDEKHRFEPKKVI